MNSIFVMGADTSVGKTVVSAGLLKAGIGTGPIGYWKPIQTGTIVGNDADEVRSLAGMPGDEHIIESTYRFTDPMSPVLAAEKWGKSLEVAPILKTFKEEVSKGKTLIIEGAGGLLSPLNEELFQADLIQALGIPVLIVGEDRTGMVNQVLLTLRCAKEWKLNILGVILMNSRAGLGNAPAIDRFGQGVKVLLEVPPMADKRSMVAYLAGDPVIRKIIGVPAIP